MRPTFSRFLRRTGVAIAGASLLLAAGGATGALAAEKATITIEIDFEGSELFTTGGGVLCPSGEAFTDFEHGGGNFVIAATYHLTKTLVCDDNTGTFTITVDAGTRFANGRTTGGWSVVGGTGAYVGLHGGGNIVGIYQSNDPLDIIDYYRGSVGL